MVHDDVRPRQHPHEPAGAAVHPRTRGDDAAGAGRLAGQPGRRLPRRGPRPHPARDALRRDDRLPGAPALPVLRHRGRHAAVRRPARRVRAVDRRRRPGARVRAGGARRARTGSTPTPTCRATATSPTSGATRRPAWRTSAGRTRGTRSRTATAGCPASRGPPASCRATPTTRRCAARAWPGSSGTTPPTPTSWSGGRGPQARFNRDFWVDDGEYYALALDADGAQVDALSSNIGHLLWSGIVDDDQGAGDRRAPARPAPVLRLGRPHPRRGRGPVQPDRVPRRHGLAVRQLVHRLGAAPLRLQGRGGPHRRRHPRRRGVLRRPAARGVRRLRARR